LACAVQVPVDVQLIPSVNASPIVRVPLTDPVGVKVPAMLTVAVPLPALKMMLEVPVNDPSG
jgi:hypothetical protein